MNARTVDKSSSPLQTHVLSVRMALLLWGIAWFVMSVFIFTLGRIIPSLRSKPPPPVLRPRSPRVRSEPISPVIAPTELVCLEKDDVVSTKSAPSDLRSAGPSSSSSKRPSFKSRWSLPNTRKSSRSSAKSSAGSVASVTLVDNNSPPRYVPDLSMIESEGGTDMKLDQDSPRSAATSLSGSTRPPRHMRLPSMKILKTFSRKKSSKQRSATVPDPSAPPPVPIASLDDEFCEPTKQARRSQSRERPGSSTLTQSEEPRPQQRVDSISGEVLTTTFVNPFRIRPRQPKASLAPSNPPSSRPPPAPRRASGTRRMLNSLHLTLATNSSHSPSVPDSPRSSISSASTSTFSASSIMSALSGSSGSPRGVRRTQPYAAPYYAPMPGTASSAAAAAAGASSSISSGKGRPDASSSKPARRRAASCSPEWRPEPVEEEESGELESEDANVLGLEFGQMQSRLPQREVQTEPHRRQTGHRLAASESVVLLGSAGR